MGCDDGKCTSWRQDTRRRWLASEEIQEMKGIFANPASVIGRFSYLQPKWS